MARPRRFEENTALDAAMRCFWRQGRESASVRALAAEMGINGPSLYNTFGDKNALFARALERYVDENVRERIDRLERDFPPKTAIVAFFEELLARSIADPEQRGCLLINAVLEAQPDDPDLHDALQRYLGEIRAFFQRCLERAAAAQDIPETLQPADMSRLLMAVVIGLRVTARLDSSAATLTGVVRPLLAQLDHPQTLKGAS